MDYTKIEDARITGLYKEIITTPEKCGIGDLNRMMQHCTENALDRLGISIDDLNERDLLWVICFSQIEIRRMPGDGEKLNVCTWPGSEKMGMYTRRYVFFAQNGEELINAASLFSLVNAKSRAMVLPSDADFVLPTVTLPDEPKLPKLTARGTEGNKEKIHKAGENEIDHNGHVNNAFYLDWAQDIIRAERTGIPDQVRNIWIGYSKEILKNDTVVMKYSLDSEGMFLRGYVNDESCFTIKCDMQD